LLEVFLRLKLHLGLLFAHHSLIIAHSFVEHSLIVAHLLFTSAFVKVLLIILIQTQLLLRDEFIYLDLFLRLCGFANGRDDSLLVIFSIFGAIGILSHIFLEIIVISIEKLLKLQLSQQK